jgi:hypothetical protein
MLARKTWCGDPQRRNRNSLSFEIANRANLFDGEQLKTAHVHASQENDRITRVDAQDGHRRELTVDVDRAGGQKRIRQLAGWLVPHVLHLREAFALEKLLRHELRRDAMHC